MKGSIRLMRNVAGTLFAGLLLAACGGGSAATAPAIITFPNTLNLPTVNLTNRVVNLSSKGGFQYVKLSLAVIFADPKGDWGKAKGEALKKLNDGFVADHSTAMSAFNDVLTTDLSSKSPEELQSPSGKEALRRQLIADFNARLAEPPQVLWIEFTDFVMQ